MIDNKKVTVLGTLIWLLASLFFLYEYFLRTFIGSVAHQVMDDFSLSVNTFAWVTSAYYFSYGAMQAPVGMLLDKFGVRKILIFGTSICACSSLMFSHSGNFIFAFISRLLMGFGSSFAFISLLVIASNWFPRKLNGFINGAALFIGTLGPILAAGPMVKLLVDSNLHWQKLIDMIGLFGFLLAFIMVLVVKSNNRDGNAMIYLQRERPFTYYLRTLIKNKQVWYIAIYSGIVYVPMILLGGAWGVPYIKSMGFNESQAANVISLLWIGYAVGALSFGGISDKIERRRPVLMYSAINNIVLILIMMISPIQPIYFYNAIFLLLGFGAAGQNIAFSTIAEHVDFATKATAMGINNMSVVLISSITPIIAAYLIHLTHGSSSEGLVPSDFFTSFVIMMPVLSALAVLIAIFLIKETFCKFQKDPIFLKVDYKSDPI